MILNALVERLRCRSKADFKGRHYEATLILQAVAWYLRYPLSYRDIEGSRAATGCFPAEGRRNRDDAPAALGLVYEDIAGSAGRASSAWCLHQA